MFNFGKRLIVVRNKQGDKIVVVRQETGELNFFKQLPDGALERLTGWGTSYELLSNPDGTYTVANADGSRQNVSADGNTQTITDKNGNALSFEYSGQGCMSRITNASGNYVDFELGSNGKIASISDSHGRTVSYTYDESGNLIASTDPMGYATQYVYDSHDRLTQIVDPRGNTVLAVTYDNHQPPRVATFSEKGETWTIAYHTDHTVKTDSTGDAWTYFFNDVGVIERVLDPLGNALGRHHNKVTSTSVDWTEDALGNRTTYTYDEDGNIAAVTDPMGNATTFTYVPGTHWMATATNAVGAVRRNEYDGLGNLTAVVRDYGGEMENVTTYQYDGLGNRTSVTDALGSSTTYVYDTDGHVVLATGALGSAISFAYDDRGNIVSRGDSSGGTSTFAYDLADRMISMTDPVGNSTAYTYDGNGNILSIDRSGGGTVTFAYDAHNRLVQETDALGMSAYYTYDAQEHVVTTTDQNGNTTTNLYDAAGRKIGVRDALGNETGWTHDANGRVVSSCDGNGNTTTYSYDSRGALIEKTYGDGARYSWTYDALGNTSSKTDPNENVTAFTYDRLNRMVTETYGDSSTTEYAYDLMDRTVTASNAGSVASYSYDGAGRVVAASMNGRVIGYAYDGVGNRMSMTTPEGDIVQYTYDAANRMVGIEFTGGSVEWTYDAAGRRVGRDYSGGTSSVYSYDLDGRMTGVVHRAPDGSAIYTQSNILDAVGNITMKTTGHGATGYGYDALDRLISASHAAQAAEAFTYDAVGNRLTAADGSTWSYNSRNQLTAYGDGTLGYDPKGNMIRRTDGSGVTDYGYDWESRLAEVHLPDGGAVSYKYDVYGRRIEKNVGGATVSYVWDGQHVLAEYDSDGNLLRRFLHGGGDANPCAMWENGALYFVHEDHLGAAEAISDQSGDVVWEALYSSFGHATVTTEHVTNGYRFPGQYFDEETGLLYNYLRYYVPRFGRYTQEDPALDGTLFGGLSRTVEANPYVYVYNNPVVLMDVSGAIPFVYTTKTGFNCYAYATNAPSSGFLQPGGGGWPAGGPTASEVLTRTIGDLGSPHNCDQPCAVCYRMVMEVFYNSSGAWDFHWYRQDDDGTWSHKPGGWPSRQTDDSGSMIADPRTADRGLYDTIIGCWCVEDRYQGTEGY